MKQAVGFPYTFDPVNKTLSLTIPRFSLRRLYAVINVTAGNRVVYAAGGGAALGATSYVPGVLNLSANLTGMSASDDLLIIYELTGTRKQDHSQSITPSDEVSSNDVPGFLVRGTIIEELLQQMLVEQRLTNLLLVQGLSIPETSLDALRADLAQS